MDDPVADILTERAAMDRGAAAAVVLSLLAHGALSAFAVWTGWHHTMPQTPSVMTIKFAKMPQVSAPPAATVAPVAPAVQKVVEPAAVHESKPVAKPVLPSPYGKSLKKATPPAPATTTAPTTTAAAAATSTQPQIAVGATGVTGLEGGDFPYTVYIDRMRNLIGSRWLRPQANSGEAATVYFVIERDGTIRDAKLETQSGNGTFDRAALRAVLESSPLPPLPFGYSGTYLGVHLNFR